MFVTFTMELFAFTKNVIMPIGYLHTGEKLFQFHANTSMYNYISYTIGISIMIMISCILFLSIFIYLFKIIIIYSNPSLCTISGNLYYMYVLSTSALDHTSHATLYIFYILLILSIVKQLNCTHVNIQMEVKYRPKPYQTKIRDGL